MPRPLADLHLAAVFLTRLPLPRLPAAPPPLARAMWAFPLVGAGLGLIGWTVLVAAERVGLPAHASALLAVAALLVLGGALHEDGLADTADGCGGSSRERKLEILRDSRIGSYGVLALIVAVGLRVVALAEIDRLDQAGAALVVAGALSRAALPLAMRLIPPARSDGLGAGAGVPGVGVVLVALAVAAALAVWLFPGSAMQAGLVAMVLVLAVTFFAWRQVGGYTGDSLGAVAVVVEVGVLLVALAQ